MLAVTVGLGIGVGLGAGVPGTAWALSCASLPTPVVVATDPSVAPLVEQVAQLLQRAEMPANQMTVIFQTMPSCSAVESVAFDNQPGVCAPGACIKGKANFWTLDPADKTPKQCDLDTKGTKVDLALADVFPQTCATLAGLPLPSILDTPGPVSTYGVVMDRRSGEAAMHAEEGHFVFGTGRTAGVKPWLNDAVIAIFGEKSAGQNLLSRHIELPVTRWKGAQVQSLDEAATIVGNDTNAGVSVMPTTYADKHRDALKVLAFKAREQKIGAFFPDRKASSFDKQNVRDGHYPLWGYVHTILRADPAKPTQPLSARGAKLADILLGRIGLAGQDTVKMQIDFGLVPQCAMRVARTADANPLTAYSTTESCACWFEKSVSGGMTTCQECKGGASCAVGKCRRELCEVQ